MPRSLQQGSGSLECLLPHVRLVQGPRPREGPHRRIRSRGRLGHPSVRSSLSRWVKVADLCAGESRSSRSLSLSGLLRRRSCTRTTPRFVEGSFLVNAAYETGVRQWIRSHRDLPLKLNQWNSVVRWEFKNPRTSFLLLCGDLADSIAPQNPFSALASSSGKRATPPSSPSPKPTRRSSKFSTSTAASTKSSSPFPSSPESSRRRRSSPEASTRPPSRASSLRPVVGSKAERLTASGRTFPRCSTSPSRTPRTREATSSTSGRTRGDFRRARSESWSWSTRTTRDSFFLLASRSSRSSSFLPGSRRRRRRSFASSSRTRRTASRRISSSSASRPRRI